MIKQSDFPICPRETCDLRMLPVSLKDNETTTEIVFECPQHNNKNNPFMKMMLGEDHESFKEPWKELIIPDMIDYEEDKQ